MAELARSLPFTFAQQHGILLQDGAEPTILHRDPLTVPILTELRRHLRQSFRLDKLTDAQFQQRL